MSMWWLAWIFGVVVIGSYVTGVVRRYGVTESLSASWYVVAHPKWFSVAMCLGAALECVALWGGSEGGLVTALGGVMCLGLFGVGLVPQFRTEDRKAHYWLASLSAIACVAMGWLLCPWMILIPLLVFCLGTLDSGEDWMWWAEIGMLAEGSVCVGLALLKGGGLC